MVQFIKGENPRGNTLQGYCGALYDFAHEIAIKPIYWLINGGEANFKHVLALDFAGDSEHDGQYESKYKDGYVKSIVDGDGDQKGLVDKFPLLRYFREYLIDHLKHDYSTGKWNALALNGYSSSIRDSI